MATIAESVKMLLASQRVTLIEGDVWGHRKDLNDYYEIPAYVIDSFFTLKADNKTEDEIVEEVSRRHQLNPEFVRIAMKDACC
jgi:hypothetical protein